VSRYHVRTTVQILLVMALAAGVNSCGSSSSGIHSSQVSSSSATPSCKTAPINNVTVPPVGGDIVREAEYVITCAKLKLATEHRANLKLPKGIVITTTPAQGVTVPTNSRVIIIISAGSDGCDSCDGIVGKTRVMPDVCGLTFQQAKTKLARDSITLDSQTISRASSEPRGKIIGTAPATGVSFLAYGSGVSGEAGRSARAVIVAISSGPARSSAATASPRSMKSCKSAASASFCPCP
jgi:hypothetical protein